MGWLSRLMQREYFSLSGSLYLSFSSPTPLFFFFLCSTHLPFLTPLHTPHLPAKVVIVDQTR